MARIRTVKPEFFTSEDITDLAPLARLLYIATWCEADKEGRLAWKPKTLKMRYLPSDDCDIDALCDALVTRGLIVPYGDGFAVIPTFKDHQHINPREKDSYLPPPGADVFTRQPRVSDATVTCREEGRKEGKEVRVNKNTFTQDDLAIAELISGKVSALTKSKKPPNLKSWANEIRLMRESDQRALNEIRAVFTWANQDSFWKSNILSPSSLRKNFDRLVAKMNSVVVPISAKNW